MIYTFLVDALPGYTRLLYFCQNKSRILFIDSILAQCRETSTAEWLAILFGLLQVVLAWQNKTLNFYAGIISVFLYIYVFYAVKLYAESLLNLYYLVISIAGIFLWNTKNKVAISRATNKEWWQTGVMGIVLFGLLYVVLKKFTSSNVPAADALVTAIAWAGTWLMIYRKLENWVLLNISNALAIPLQIYKGLELTAVYTLILFIVAVFGYFHWKKELHRKE